MNVRSVHLSELEAKARADAVKRVAEFFQKPEQLEKIDMVKARFIEQKTATEVQLRMALHSQLDGSRIGLEKLDSSLSESEVCKTRLMELSASLGTLEGLPARLQELKNISRKYSQLAAAMENMSYLVKVPEAMEQARSYIESENLLEGHKILTSAVVTQNVLVVDCVRVIDREERADAIWQKRSEKNGFLPCGRPKRWKQLFFDSVNHAIRDKVFGSAMDSDDDKNKLVRHNEAIRQHTRADLKIAKVHSLVTEGLSDTQIVQLLGWINSYHTEEFMKDPVLNIDFSRLNLLQPINLLPESQLDGLREQYIAKTIARLGSWSTNSLSRHAADWRRPTAPDLDGSSYYFTGLPVLVMSPLTELLGKGNLLQFLGVSVRERFFVKFVEQMSYFVGEYDQELREFHQSYLRDRSQFRFYFEYMLASANDALVFADSIVKILMQELAEDAQLKGRMAARINSLKGDFERIAEHCRLAAEETILLDLNFVLTNVMTPQWLRPDDITGNCFHGTLADYDETLKHVRPVVYNELVNRLGERLLIEYLKVLLTRRCPFRSDSERHTAGEKILHDGQMIKNYLVEKMKVRSEVGAAYDCLPEIAQMFMEQDPSMLYLDIAKFVKQFPDVRTDQIYTILLSRGDLRSSDAKEGPVDPSHCVIFYAVGVRQSDQFDRINIRVSRHGTDSQNDIKFIENSDN
ncbi:Exocyst complex component 3 [Fasciolopsis buskii]|uniref:Exocyst complex component 3 n=1 Tax=Fasciolopsis buskii TaxID=27845 RepID=A0A8E0VIB9_9TREM|nr:Exocyst complex component 3 [Fasciolopsis buski]